MAGNHGSPPRATASHRAVAAPLPEPGTQIAAERANTPAERAASPDAPHYTHSWYITDLSGVGSLGPRSALYRLGYSDGLWDDWTCASGWAVLDFGQVGFEDLSYGTYTFADGHPFVDDSTIAGAVEDYAQGWADAARSGATGEVDACGRLILAVGTNNYIQCPHLPCSAYDAGAAWLGAVRQVDLFLRSDGIDTLITAAGGADIESGWDPAWKTREFVDGFTDSDAYNFTLYDYGDAAPSRGWSDADVYAVSGGALHTAAIPEVYTQQPAAQRWAQVQQEFPSLVYQGVMSECGDPYPLDLSRTTCYSPAWEYAPHAARSGLRAALSSSGDTLAYMTNIKYQGMA